jgi:flavin reductase (DIM6/NTAB) family NADH-FMN oxidoreductase RutF
MAMKNLPLSKVYQLLEPGPVVLLTTARNGRANVMTMSWHMMVEFEPPLIACVVSGADYSFAALRATRECVIALPDLKLAPKVVQVGNCSGRDVDKFAAFGLTPVPAEKVAAPLIAECFANLECKVADTPPWIRQIRSRWRGDRGGVGHAIRVIQQAINDFSPPAHAAV